MKSNATSASVSVIKKASLVVYNAISAVWYDDKLRASLYVSEM